MKNRNILTLLTLSLAICLVGCAEPPTAGVDAAKARLAAVANEANTYAAGAYTTAEAAPTSPVSANPGDSVVSETAPSGTEPSRM